MATSFKDANRLLTRALFVMGADTFERRFIDSVTSLRDLLVSALNIAIPEAAFAPGGDDAGSLAGRIESQDANFTISVRNVQARMQASNSEGAREHIVAFLIEALDTYARMSEAKQGSHLKGTWIAMIGSDKKMNDYNDQLGQHSILSWPISENLNALVAVDGPRSVAYVQRQDLAKLGMSEDEAREKVLASIRRKMKDDPPRYATANGVLVVEGCDSLVSSLLVLDEFVQSLRHRLGDDAVFVPGEGVVLAASRSDGQALFLMTSLVLAGEIKSLCPGTYFLVDEAGTSTLAPADVAELIRNAPEEPPVSSPTFN